MNQRTRGGEKLPKKKLTLQVARTCETSNNVCTSFNVIILQSRYEVASTITLLCMQIHVYYNYNISLINCIYVIFVIFCNRIVKSKIKYYLYFVLWTGIHRFELLRIWYGFISYMVFFVIMKHIFFIYELFFNYQLLPRFLDRQTVCMDLKGYMTTCIVQRIIGVTIKQKKGRNQCPSVMVFRK